MADSLADRDWGPPPGLGGNRVPQGLRPGMNSPRGSLRQDPRDGWEPSVPSLRALAPSIIGGAVVPIGAFYLVRAHVSGDEPALVIAGIPAALWVASQWMRTRRLDPVGAISLVGFIVGLAASYALGGSAFVLKIREAAVTSVFAAGCLASIWLLPRPVMFYVGRVLSAGNDPVRQDLFDQVWDLPSAPRLFATITVVWGCGVILDAAIRIFLATILPTGPFLAISPPIDGAFIAAMFITTIVLSQRFRSQVEPEGERPQHPVSYEIATGREGKRERS